MDSTVGQHIGKDEEKKNCGINRHKTLIDQMVKSEINRSKVIGMMSKTSRGGEFFFLGLPFRFYAVGLVGGRTKKKVV